MVQRHIKSLLYEYDCVIIPDFGGLITHYAPAKIHPVKNTFSPPSKRIAFNEQLKVNDGLLITTLAHKCQWPTSQAQKAVAEFVKDLKAQLLEKHQFELSDVGVFRYNIERKLIFESIDSDNFLETSFGLPEIVAKPIIGKETLILRGNYQDKGTSIEGNPKKLGQRLRRWYKIGASLVVGGFIVTGLYLLSLQSDVALSSLNPFSMLSTSEVSLPAPSDKPLADVYTSEQADLDAFDQAYAKEQLKQNALSEQVIEAADDQLNEDSVLADIPSISSDTQKASVVPDLEETLPASKLEEVDTKSADKSVSALDKPSNVKASSTSEAEHIIKGKTGRYYVIMGVFEKAPYATLNQKRFSKEGFSAKTLVPSRVSRLYKVSLADYKTAEEAQTALNSLREKTGLDLWVLNY